MAQILLAVDGVTSMRLGAALFEDTDLEVDAVTDGRTALERLTQAPNFYDLIVMDYDLPEISCVECLRFVGQMLTRLPTIVLSEDEGDARLNELAGLGVASGFVMSRTVSPDAFAEHVKNALSTARREG
jgi:CheY-like chemotaxis protein